MNQREWNKKVAEACKLHRSGALTREQFDSTINTLFEQMERAARLKSERRGGVIRKTRPQ